MSIALRQYREIYNRYLLEYLKEGKVPSFEEVVARAGSDLPKIDQPAAPLYFYKPQPANSVFDIDMYNKAMSHILTDLKILFAELTEIELNNIQRILHSDLFHSVHSYELNRLNRQLDSLLFALQGADDNFVSAYENFGDVSKLNPTLSTNGVIDLDERCLSLPIGGKGTFKIDLSHLYSSSNPNITLDGKNLNLVGSIPGTNFGDIFRDSNKAWGIIIESPIDQPVSIKFTFALSAEEFINKITLLHHGSKSQTAYISTSVDNVNIKDIVEYSSGIILDDQSKIVSLDFSDTLVEYIQVTLTKQNADITIINEGSQTFRYIFGLKNISLFSTGRVSSATYVSQSFDFTNDVGTLSKISISSSESIPDGTSIDWSIGLINSDDVQVGSYLPITPESRSASSGPSKIIQLQDTIKSSLYIVSTSYTNVFNYNSILFYCITTLTDEPIFGTAQLFRGQRAWFRDTQGSFDTLSVKDNFIPFSKGNTQKLYNTIQEVVTIRSVQSVSDQRVALVSNAPLYTDSGPYTLIPSAGINTIKDTAPIYAIYNVNLSAGNTSAQKANVSFSSGSVDLGQPNILYKAKGDILVQEIVTTGFGQVSVGTIVKEFVDGTDYIVELNADSTPTGRILAIAGSTLLSSPQYSPNSQYVITYTIDADVTRFVSNIINNQIFFTISATNSNVLTDVTAIIKYRYVPTDIIKSSVKVKAGFGSSGEDRIFKQGADYIFDSSNSTIQKLSTGSIANDQDVFVDYQYNDTTANLEQFFLWAYVSDPNGINILVKTLGSGTLNNQNTLLPDTALGEQLYASIPSVGLVKLTSAVEWPTMKGWVQFIVKSRSPESVQNTSSQALIDQVIRLQDNQNNYIFVSGGRYFNELTGIREPLKQVSLPFLKTNVLKNDRSNFAIREILVGNTLQYQVITNFAPGSTSDLYTYAVDSNTGNITKNAEEWKLLWSSSDSQDAFKKIVVKANLNRLSSVNGNITPKVFNYYLKVAY